MEVKVRGRRVGFGDGAAAPKTPRIPQCDGAQIGRRVEAAPFKTRRARCGPLRAKNSETVASDSSLHWAS